MNFAVALTGVGREGRGRARASGPTPPVAADILIKNILAGDLTDATRSTIARAASAPQAIALVLGSPEFQRR
jgi:uncharacterized protein (DUF1800 family)